jgi:hypothetical protein
LLVAHSASSLSRRRPTTDNHNVPRFSAFYGIVIYMYRPHHPPPHFHAQYGEHIAQIGRIQAEAVRLGTPVS